jgi:hypothetical protein
VAGMYYQNGAFVYGDGRSTAASKVNAFIWNHYSTNTIKRNKIVLANKCMKLYNIYTASAEYLKRRGKSSISSLMLDILMYA